MLNIVCPSASNDIEVVSSRCADRQVNILWGDPSNNTRFHSCLNYETAIVLTCPWSYHFFEDEQACLPPLLLDTSTTMASTQPDEITIVTNLPVTRTTDLPCHRPGDHCLHHQSVISSRQYCYRLHQQDSE